jgi:hypothetical protein
VKTKLLSALIIFAICLVAAVAQTTEADWQREAVRRYPALGVPGSALNKTFLAEYQRRKQMPSQATFFANPRWPMYLADECAQQVAAGTAPPANPTNPFANWTIPNANGLPGTLPNFSNAGSAAAVIIPVLVISIVIGLLIGAMFVMLATRIVAGFTPSLGMACAAIFLSVCASVVLAVVLTLLRAGSGSQLPPIAGLISILVSIIVHSSIYGSVLRDRATPIGTGKGCLVILLQNILVVIALVCIFVICVLAGVSLPILNHLQQKQNASQALPMR